jgi:hypothetical protein
MNTIFAQRHWLGVLALGATCTLLTGCGNGSETVSSTKSITVSGDVPIAYVQRANSLNINPTDGTPFAAGGDLMIREKSSPTAREYNITSKFTMGKGDASDPEVSYDGKKIVFSMRCPTENAVTIDGKPACTGRWNIWEYDMTVGGFAEGTFKRLTHTTTDDDVDPAYLPAGGGFVFASNRQTKSKDLQAVGGPYFGLDEYERERVLNIHTMDAKGEKITQISFNQSHDRNPVVRPNGDIMFSRWEHVGPRNRFAVFRAKPDGTDMFVLYGAQSPGNSFLHPRDMDPSGKYKGFLSSSLMSLSGTQEGGALMFIDAGSYSEQNTPANSGIPAQGGQLEVTAQKLGMDRGLSMYGRITSPYPLWDGTNRVLAGYAPCEVSRNGVTIPCANLTADEITRLNNEDRTEAEVAADTVKDDVNPSYGVYMFDSTTQTWLPVATPPKGFMLTDPVALQARAEPNATAPTAIDASLAAKGLALIEVRSIYDTDGLDRMGESMLTAVDLPVGCTAGIAQTAPLDSLDTRTRVADLLRIKDPAQNAYHCAPARFVRATRAVAPPSNSMGLRSSIGETEFEQQQILGYAPIEPDGSFKLQVPADVPLALAVVDSKGRGIQTHLNWIQVRPGERRTCDGCHSPRRGGALNSGSIVNTLPSSWLPNMSGAHQSGETMAATRTRLDENSLKLAVDMLYTDIWADTSKTGVSARPTIAIRYTGNTTPTDDLATPAPVNGLINYPQHIQPLWTRDRGANTCTQCHADIAKLDLREQKGGTGRLTSYEELLMGDPVIDPATGQPQFRVVEGVPEIVRGAPLVESSSGNATGMARSSRLTEIMFGELLKAATAARTAHPNPPAAAPNHATMLNAAEKRLLSEWMDLGGQYYNNPFDGGVKNVVALSQTTFESQVHSILTANCASCHQPRGAVNTGTSPNGTDTSFRQNRFVLTGNPEGDYNVTLSMISDTCRAANNYLLSRPSTVPHPAGAVTQTAAVLPVGSAGYTSIANWITSGCGTP